jgi:hypothetical protein
VIHKLFFLSLQEPKSRALDRISAADNVSQLEWGPSRRCERVSVDARCDTVILAAKWNVTEYISMRRTLSCLIILSNFFFYSIFDCYYRSTLDISFLFYWGSCVCYLFYSCSFLFLSWSILSLYYYFFFFLFLSLTCYKAHTGNFGHQLYTSCSLILSSTAASAQWRTQVSCKQSAHVYTAAVQITSIKSTLDFSASCN